VLVPECTENVLRFIARLDDGAQEVCLKLLRHGSP
jgi:hypothetical protein